MPIFVTPGGGSGSVASVSGNNPHVPVDTTDASNPVVGYLDAIEILYADLLILKTAQTLKAGWYKITDRGIYVKATDNANIASRAIGLFPVCDFSAYPLWDFTGVVTLNTSPYLTLNISNQSGLFAVGDILTGDDNNSTAEIINDSDQNSLVVRVTSGDWSTETSFTADSTETADIDSESAGVFVVGQQVSVLNGYVTAVSGTGYTPVSLTVKFNVATDIVGIDGQTELTLTNGAQFHVDTVSSTVPNAALNDKVTRNNRYYNCIGAVDPVNVDAIPPEDNPAVWELLDKDDADDPMTLVADDITYDIDSDIIASRLHINPDGTIQEDRNYAAGNIADWNNDACKFTIDSNSTANHQNILATSVLKTINGGTTNVAYCSSVMDSVVDDTTYANTWNQGVTDVVLQNCEPVTHTRNTDYIYVRQKNGTYNSTIEDNQSTCKFRGFGSYEWMRNLNYISVQGEDKSWCGIYDNEGAVRGVNRSDDVEIIRNNAYYYITNEPQTGEYSEDNDGAEERIVTNNGYAESYRNHGGVYGKEVNNSYWLCEDNAGIYNGGEFIDSQVIHALESGIAWDGGRIKGMDTNFVPLPTDQNSDNDIWEKGNSTFQADLTLTSSLTVILTYSGGVNTPSTINKRIIFNNGVTGFIRSDDGTNMVVNQLTGRIQKTVRLALSTISGDNYTYSSLVTGTLTSASGYVIVKTSTTIDVLVVSGDFAGETSATIGVETANVDSVTILSGATTWTSESSSGNIDAVSDLFTPVFDTEKISTPTEKLYAGALRYIESIPFLIDYSTPVGNQAAENNTINFLDAGNNVVCTGSCVTDAQYNDGAPKGILVVKGLTDRLDGSTGAAVVTHWEKDGDPTIGGSGVGLNTSGFIRKAAITDNNSVLFYCADNIDNSIQPVASPNGNAIVHSTEAVQFIRGQSSIDGSSDFTLESKEGFCSKIVNIHIIPVLQA